MVGKGHKGMLLSYAQTMNDKTQYGFVVCANVHDYVNGVIKKHELTRREKKMIECVMSDPQMPIWNPFFGVS